MLFSHLPFSKGSLGDSRRQGFGDLIYRILPLTLPLSPSGEREEVKGVLTSGIDF
jgi:hypothetical protein